MTNAEIPKCRMKPEIRTTEFLRDYSRISGFELRDSLVMVFLSFVPCLTAFSTTHTFGFLDSFLSSTVLDSFTIQILWW